MDLHHQSINKSILQMTLLYIIHLSQLLISWTQPNNKLMFTILRFTRACLHTEQLLCGCSLFSTQRENLQILQNDQSIRLSQKFQPLKERPILNKEEDMKLASLYQEVMQKQRTRMDHNQRRMDELIANERQRFDKKQEEMHNQFKQFLKSIQTLMGVGGLLGLIYYILTVVNEGSDAFQKLKKYWQETFSKYELIQKYSMNDEKLPHYYLKGNSIETVLSQIQFPGVIGLSYIVGIPGSGKTTGLKKVINDLRLKIKKGENSYWKKIYYINLRVDDENGKLLAEKTKERIEELSRLLKIIFSQEEHYKKALIVIDDIQMLEKVMSESEAKEILQSIVFKCEIESCKFVVVSSSSFSCYRALSNANFRKLAYITEIQNLTQPELRKALDNRIQYEKETNGIDIPNSIRIHVQEYDSIRRIMNSINLVVNQFRVNQWAHREVCQARLLQKVNDNDFNKIWDMKIKMTRVLREKETVLGKKTIAQIIRCILKQTTEIKLRDKFTIIEEVVAKIPSLLNHIDEISDVIDELDQINILIFGHPRSMLERKALKEILKGFIM